MVNIGNILGGVAGERGRREERERKSRVVDLQARQVGLGERQFEFGQEQAEAATQQDAAEVAITNFQDHIEGLAERKAGPNPPGPQAFEGARAAFAQAEEVLGPEVVADLNRRLDLVEGRPTGIEAAEFAGEVAGTEEVVGLQTLLGREPTEEELVRKADVEAPTPQADPDVVRLVAAKEEADARFDTAVASGDKADASKAQFAADSINAQIKQRTLANVDPSLITPTTRAKAEGDVRQSALALDAAKSLLTLIENTEGNLGLPGAIKSGLNKVLGQVIPQVFSKDRAIVEAAIETTRTTLKRIMDDEGRFSDQDRKDVFGLFPETGIFESDQEAQIKMRAIMVIFARKLVASSTVPEVEIPVELSNFTSQDIRTAVLSGILSREEGFKMIKALFPEVLSK